MCSPPFFFHSFISPWGISSECEYQEGSSLGVSWNIQICQRQSAEMEDTLETRKIWGEWSSTTPDSSPKIEENITRIYSFTLCVMHCRHCPCLHRDTTFDHPRLSPLSQSRHFQLSISTMLWTQIPATPWSNNPLCWSHFSFFYSNVSLFFIPIPYLYFLLSFSRAGVG